MEIKTKGRFGKFILSMVVQVKDEDAATLLAEEVKTRVASAVVSAGKKDARDAYSREELVAAITTAVGARMPKYIEGFTCGIDEDWVAKDGSLAVKMAEERKATLALLRAAGVPEEALSNLPGYVVAGGVAEVASPTAPVIEQQEELRPAE